MNGVLVTAKEEKKTREQKELGQEEIVRPFATMIKCAQHTAFQGIQQSIIVKLIPPLVQLVMETRMLHVTKKQKVS